MFGSRWNESAGHLGNSHMCDPTLKPALHPSWHLHFSRALFRIICLTHLKMMALFCCCIKTLCVDLQCQKVPYLSSGTAKGVNKTLLFDDFCMRFYKQ